MIFALLRKGDIYKIADIQGNFIEPETALTLLFQ